MNLLAECHGLARRVRLAEFPRIEMRLGGFR